MQPNYVLWGSMNCTILITKYVQSVTRYFSVTNTRHQSKTLRQCQAESITFEN